MNSTLTKANATETTPALVIDNIRFHQPVQFAGKLGMTALIKSGEADVSFTPVGGVIVQQKDGSRHFIPMTSVQIARLK